MTKHHLRLIPLMTLALGAAAALGGCGGTEEPPKTPPSISAFTASPSSVMSGQTTNLSYKAANATSITITAMPGGVLVDGTSKLEDTVTSKPITETTTFTITASGPGGDPAVRMLTVTVSAPPPEVRIISFTAMPTDVAPGGMVTLRWEVENATRIKIAELNGADLHTSTMQTGTFAVMPTRNTTYVITAEGQGGPKNTSVDVTVTVPTPVVQVFAAEPAAIELGQSSTLRWMVTNATMITIRNSRMQVETTSTMASGTFTVTPMANETYTLTAVNGTMMATSNPVMVTVNRAARIASFTANPTSIDYGASSELRWDVSRAPQGVVISTLRNGVTSTLTTSMMQMGAFTVTPTRTTEYRLTALNPDGRSTAMVTVSVNQVAPRILAFTASPNPLRRTTQTTLTWMTAGATRVRILNGMTEVRTSTALSGTHRVTITSSVTRFTLEATNPNGGSMSTVTVIGLDPPVITAFSAVPLTFSGTTTTATVTWRTMNTTTTGLTINGRPAAGFARTASGTFTFTATSSVRLVLTATNAIGSASSTFSIFKITAVMEGANTASTAVALRGDGSGVAAAIDRNGDQDWYAIDVPEGGSVYAETSDGRGGCATDTLIRLMAPDGTTQLASDDDDGIGSCSQIDPARDAGARVLAAGRYYIVVRHFGSGTGPYVLLVRVTSPSCGNGFKELTEQCDDGNAMAGDGCTAACTAEIAGTFSGPPGSMTFTGAIPTVRSSRFYQITMLSAGYVRAETFVPSVGRCDAAAGSAATEIVLYDAMFRPLGSDTTDGIAACSKIDPIFDAFASLAAGTYYLEVRESGNDATIGAFALQLSAVGQGCPNGIIEPGEFCDDGNNTNGDGCSALCEFEGTRDTEPNNTSATANVVVTTASTALVLGAIVPMNDVDYYAIDIPQGAHLDVYATVNSFTSCPTDPTARIRLFNSMSTTALATNSSGGPDGNCGRIWPYTTASARNMAAGRYYIAVDELGANAQIARYFLHVRVILPGCGNTIIEGTEQCEDGNMAGGDGCSAACTYEPVATVNLPSPARQIVMGSINPSYNRDAIRINVTAPTVFRAETFIPDVASGGCASGDTRLRLLASDGVRLIGEDDNDGILSCSLIDPDADMFTRLSTGTYYLVVEESGNDRTIFSYEVAIDGRPPNTCGNFATEMGEQCDDGNTLPGDHCDPMCRLITQGTFTGPTRTPMTFDGSLPVGDFDIYRIDLTAEAVMRIETGIPTIGVCPSGDTFVTLLDANLTILTDSDDEGISLCSLIDGITDPAAILPAGTYYVVVEEYQRNAEIPAYQLLIDAQPRNLCGNGIVEASNMEFCDDRNNVSGDGCSATCRFEPEATWMPAVGTSTTIRGAIMPADEIDAYQIVVTQPIYLRAETFAPNPPSCTSVATVLRLYGDDASVRATDTVGGVNSCSLLTRTIHPGVRLTPGTYFLTVEESGRNAVIGTYALVLNAVAADVCGDGIQEAAAGEQCDDGNTANGDGCDSMCRFEPDATLTAPGNVAFTNAITPVGDFDAIRITATSSVYIRAETFAPMFGTCPSGTSTMLLLVDNRGRVIGSDAGDGINSCSRIDPTLDPWAKVGPGTYFIRIEENGNNAMIASYEVRVSAVTAGVCGNGFVDRDRGEQCDDRNNASGDGCSASCTFERTVSEAEPNDTAATATSLGLAGPGAVQAAGGVVPAGDRDFFSFVVPPGMPLTLRARTYSALNDPTSVCMTGVTDTRLILFDSAGAELVNNDDIAGSANVCSYVDGTIGDHLRAANLAPGTYTLRVTHYSDTSGTSSPGTDDIAMYFLYVNLVAP